MAYNLSEQVEEHAFHTYDEFLKANESELKAAPPPPIAVHYYTQGDLFLFDEFQTGSVPNGGVERRRPSIGSLYDVFVNVRNDEGEHMKTMQFCQLPGTIMRAPSEAAACAATFNSGGSDAASNIVPSGGDEGGRKKAGSGRAAASPDVECADAYAGVMDRTCEGLMDCLLSQRLDDLEEYEPVGEAPAVKSAVKEIGEAETEAAEGDEEDSDTSGPEEGFAPR